MTSAAADLSRDLAPLDLRARLARIAALPGRKVFTTSLGIEDQVLNAAIAETSKGEIEVATLETGRLFPETKALIDETESRLAHPIERYFPVEADIAAYIAAYGRDGFYESVEARHACCEVRKLRPLARALKGAAVWITGVRRGQSTNRAETPLAELDATRGLLKVNPLADVSLDEIRDYAAAKGVPLNPLHARGYPSIGCEPCTRAVKPGESERAGRWWWEQDQTRECGLHMRERDPAASLQAVSTVRQPSSATPS